jgi:hypothetical protein
MGERYTPQIFSIVAGRFPEGVPEDRIDALAAALCPVAPAEEASSVPALRIAGGDA